MMQRLLEVDLRADSMTSSAPLPRFRTQASNFSFRRRSAALAVTITVSMLNWRKQSVRTARFDSFSPTSAARAAVFRTNEMGARVVAKALFIAIGEDDFQNDCASVWATRKVPKGQRGEPRRVITRLRTARERTLRDWKAAPDQGFKALLPVRTQA